MEFRILGPLEVRADGRAVAVPGAKPRAVLAVLLLHPNQAVSPDQLALALWGEEAPAGAGNTVQVHISRLRKALGNTESLATTPGGYRLTLGPDDLDALRFDRLVAEARGQSPADAAATLAQALALWRGRALEDLAYEPFAQPEIARLEDARIAAHEMRFEAQLALGAHAGVIGELEALIAEHPYREGLRAQLMLALYRADRQADALQAYQDARAKLVDELGIEPGERLRELERAILAQDPALAAPVVAAREAAPAPAETAALAAPLQASRRLVTVVSAGFAARLDAESLHSRLDAYAALVERHGGEIEGSVGDALVAVFGRTTANEDDALRAVRAAVDLRAAGLKTIGIETGEAFVGPSRVTGEVFAVAAGLERAANADEILLGDGVHELVHHAVKAEPAGGAWRLLALAGDGDRSHKGPFVDRHAELDGLRAAFARARDERTCHAITLVGPAGMGKSRLTREFIAEVEPAATVAVGRCPTYGEGLAYRPLAEIVEELGGSDRIRTRLAGDETAATIVLGAIGLADGPAQAEETFWAVRRLFETIAEPRPLVVVVEDVHWAQPALLDLLEYLTAFVSGHPVLLVCLARPDLGELRPTWMTPRAEQSLLVLAPLPDAEAHRLVEHAGEVVAATAARIVATAEGNPLFLQQLVAVGTDGDELPATIQAVLAARIARLDPEERALLGEASVQGRSFYVGALEDRSATKLVSLVRQELIRPDRSELPGEDAFRFAHALIREAAYRALPKQRRADVHERVARWSEDQPGAHDATVGHHLAEAYRYRTELGTAGGHEALAGEAAERLADAADAASLRGDPDAAARLLEHAASLLEWFPAARAETLPALAAALYEAGRIDEATRVADEAIAVAPDDRLRVRAQVERELIRLETGAGTGQARQVSETAEAALADDDYGRCRLAFLRGRIAWDVGQVAAAEAAWADAAELARRAGAQRELFELVGWRALAAVLGPTPVDDAIRRCEEWRELVRTSPLATASTLNPLAVLHAMKGDVERADALLAEAGAILSELGGLTAGYAHLATFAFLLTDRPERAEAALRAHGETPAEGSGAATTQGLLAHAVLDQGRADEADEIRRLAERTAADDDTLTQVLWRCAAARILTGDEAIAVAREAVARAEASDLLWHQGDAMLALAEALRASGRTDEADDADRAARALYDRKGIAVRRRPGGT